MANRDLFRSEAHRPKKADTKNRAGGRAYSYTDKHALAQFACTGCFSNTYYADARDQLKDVQKLVPKVDSDFLAKVAIYSRSKGYMKDMPAFMCAELAARLRAANFAGEEREGSHLETLHAIVFDRVIDNARMLRNYVQFLRSGVFGFSVPPQASRRLVRGWFQKSKPEYLFRQTVGKDPSLLDVIKLFRPKPENAAQSVLFQYILGTKKDRPGEGMFHWDPSLLPRLVKDWEAFKRGELTTPPNVPFQMLSSLPLTKEQWMEICRNAPYMMTRMNLNTFSRHGVFESKEMVQLVADRLRDREQIKRARQFPYQFMTAYMNLTGVPAKIQNALQDAMEIAVENVPSYDADLIVVCPDVSGSMRQAITGNRRGATSKTSCVDVAAMIATVLCKRNEDNFILMPVDTAIHRVQLNPRDSIMSNAMALARFGGGGTNLSLPLLAINQNRLRPDLVVFISDNESWVDRWGAYYDSTKTETEWNKIRQRHKKARMVRIDLVPNRSTQISMNRPEVLNVGGFSDAVFDVMGAFLKSDLDKEDAWVTMIEETVVLEDRLN